jgi:hypothetical protein
MDPINPDYYVNNPTGIEPIKIERHLPTCLGNAMKYIWRVGFGGKPGNDPVQDLRKAIRWLEEEIDLRQGGRDEFTDDNP